MNITMHIHVRDGFALGQNKIRLGIVSLNVFQLISLVGFQKNSGYVMGLVHGMGFIDDDSDEIPDFSDGRVVGVGCFQFGVQRGFFHWNIATRDGILLIVHFDEQLVA